MRIEEKCSKFCWSRSIILNIYNTMEFDKDKTVAIIFDTEWYVPPEDRVSLYP